MQENLSLMSTFHPADVKDVNLDQLNLPKASDRLICKEKEILVMLLSYWAGLAPTENESFEYS